MLYDVSIQLLSVVTKLNRHLLNCQPSQPHSIPILYEVKSTFQSAFSHTHHYMLPLLNFPITFSHTRQLRPTAPTTRVKSKQIPWTIILLVYVGSIADLIGLTNTNDNRSRDRYNVELRFKVYYISAGQTSLLRVQ